MKPELIEEFRKGFEFIDASNVPRTSLDDAYDSVGTVDVGAKPLMFGGGCCGGHGGVRGSGGVKFEIDMSHCDWRQRFTVDMNKCKWR